MTVTWLTQGGFLFELDGVRMVVDPYMSDGLERSHGLARMVAFPLALAELRPDVLFCTHDHLDHLDPETVCAVADAYPSCRFAGPASCMAHFEKLGLAPSRCTLATLGERWTCGDLQVTPVAAFHSDPDAVGLVISDGHRRLYLSGDSVSAPELINAETRQADVVLICINGRLGNMAVDEALALVRTIQPRLALPMHYGLFAANTADPAPFVEGCAAMGIASFAMQPGVPFKASRRCKRLSSVVSSCRKPYNARPPAASAVLL